MKPLRPMWRLAVVAMAMALLVPACSHAAVSQDHVSLQEYSIQTGNSHWSAGQVEIQVDNKGEFSHTLVVTAEDGTVVAASAVLPPGQDSTLDLDLPPGKYQLTCRIVVQTDAGLIDHYERGMHTTVEVGS